MEISCVVSEQSNRDLGAVYHSIPAYTEQEELNSETLWAFSARRRKRSEKSQFHLRSLARYFSRQNRGESSTCVRPECLCLDVNKQIKYEINKFDILLACCRAGRVRRFPLFFFGKTTDSDPARGFCETQLGPSRQASIAFAVTSA